MITDIEIRRAPRWRVASFLAALCLAVRENADRYLLELEYEAPQRARGEN